MQSELGVGRAVMARVIVWKSACFISFISVVVRVKRIVEQERVFSRRNLIVHTNKRRHSNKLKRNHHCSS